MFSVGINTCLLFGVLLSFVCLFIVHLYTIHPRTSRILSLCGENAMDCLPLSHTHTHHTHARTHTHHTHMHTHTTHTRTHTTCTHTTHTHTRTHTHMHMHTHTHTHTHLCLDRCGTASHACTLFLLSTECTNIFCT